MSCHRFPRGSSAHARHVDRRTRAAFTALVSFVSSLLFGTFPALHGTRREAISALRGDVGQISDGRAGTRLRRALVVAQVALAVVLMVSASLLARSLSNALRADLGFGTREAVLASVELPLTDFSPAQGAAFYQSAVERVRALPGVEAASLVRTLRSRRRSPAIPRRGLSTATRRRHRTALQHRRRRLFRNDADGGAWGADIRRARSRRQRAGRHRQ